MSGPYNPRWKSKKPAAGKFEPILGKKGPLYGTHFKPHQPGHETTSEIKDDVTQRMRELLDAEIERQLYGAAYGGVDPRVYTNSNTAPSNTTVDEIREKMREAMATHSIRFNARQAREWMREYDSGEWDSIRDTAQPQSPGPLEGELIVADRKQYEPNGFYKPTHSVANGKCRIRYRGASIVLDDSERKTRSKDALVGTIGLFCKLIDQQKDIIP